ncbi:MULTISPECIES: glycosyl hydrolase [unclassified Fibrobacter]|uniref:glycosyl hydrolase n=1 Tax=unclassified Fibrobacter TaxID=2634177 RepID=UPI000D7AB588|nr:MULTISPECIES: glycosyl hydrolase [unclassified Fibrobacter]PWJ65516.1 mannan endo-1,4-beta-mannosidase [Fibrobacter sp. UWR4]PZW72281.1 mannan endo-1,4-beta-mannosidase [Fibrobacter sp. UWR1]
MGIKLTLAALMGIAAVASAADAVKYEAEEQTGVTAGDILTGDEYSGGKYVKVGAAMTFTVKVDETAMYDIETQVLIKQYDWTTSKILVNDAEVGSMLTTPRNCDSAYVITASAKMKAGENTITVGNGAIGVDYISVGRHPDPEFKISALPVTPNATESAMKVKTFLRDNFMKKTISGMMISDQNFNYDYGNMKLLSAAECTPQDSCKFLNGEDTWKGQTDIAEFYKRSGHYPAIGGFDMLFAAGGHHEEGWFRGYTENNLVMTEDLWNMGGIPTYTWHWKVGKDTVFYTQMQGFKNAGCTEDVAGTAENNTCFNYTKAFKGESCAEIDETSQEYKDIVADVDIVSGYFKQLEEKGIAVVWRPLHEASGGWFWWGVGSPECYVQLWRLVFDRMVNVNKNKNLIWVWNINTDPKFGYDYSALNGAWYPGAEYVDIVAVDIYDPLNNHNSAANYWNKIIEEVGTDKMIALSENGAIPDIDSIAEDKSYWSYWMTWSQTWSGNFLEKTSTDMWKRNLDDERIIALDDMPGWDKVVADKSTEGAIIAPSKVIANRRQLIAGSMNIDVIGNTIQMNIPTAGRGAVALYDLHGKLAMNIVRGNINAGTLSVSTATLPRGKYILRAIVGSNSLNKVVNVQ